MYQYLGNTEIKLYDIFVYVGALLVFLWYVFQIKEKQKYPCKISEKIIQHTENKKSNFPIKPTLAFLELLIFFTFQYLLAGEYNIWFGKLLDMGPNYYGTALIGPFILAAVCFIMRADILKIYDLITPSYPLGLIAAKFGCFCAGCCHGIEWEHGLYNNYTKATEFPVQLVEMGTAFLIFIFLLLIRKKAKTGTLFPTFLILYSSTRFISEFTRNEPDIVGKLKLYHLCCLAGIAFGILFLIIALVFGDKISRFYTKDFKRCMLIEKWLENINFHCHYKKKKKNKNTKQIVHRNRKSKKNKKKK